MKSFRRLFRADDGRIKVAAATQLPGGSAGSSGSQSPIATPRPTQIVLWNRHRTLDSVGTKQALASWDPDPGAHW